MRHSGNDRIVHGNGEAIVANKEGVRCGLCWSEQVAVWIEVDDALELSEQAEL